MEELKRSLMRLSADWQSLLMPELAQSYCIKLGEFLTQERAVSTVFPPEGLLFEGLRLVPFDQVRVVILGQDPYHDDGQAQGLSFSVPEGQSIPPSLRNIFKELAQDLQTEIPTTGDLHSWAHQGVLLLNTVLSVRAHEANSHQKRGWEKLTDVIIQALGKRKRPIAFILWGSPAQKKRPLIDLQHGHLLIESVHPSPLSANRGFFGSKPFSQVNQFLQSIGEKPIDWSLKPSAK